MGTYDLASQKIAEPKANNSAVDVVVKPVSMKAAVEKGAANTRLMRYILTLFWQQASQSCH
jgi:hypothetical protein